MGKYFQFLSPDEVASLSQEESEILQRAMEHELHTSDAIKAILRRRVQAALADLRRKPTSGSA